MIGFRTRRFRSCLSACRGPRCPSLSGPRRRRNSPLPRPRRSPWSARRGRHSGSAPSGLAPGASLRIEHIRRRLADLHPAPFGLTAEDVLLRLQALGGGGPGVRLQDMGETIERQPLEFTSDHVGTAGPLLGSIHGAKGREAADVLLMLPPVPSKDDVDWQEEARVLFVGATRASRNLYLGRAQAGTIRYGANGSRWLRGVGGGLILSGFDGLRPLPGVEAVFSVWEAAFRQPNCSFQRANLGGQSGTCSLKRQEHHERSRCVWAELRHQPKK